MTDEDVADLIGLLLDVMEEIDQPLTPVQELALVHTIYKFVVERLK
jgi:hypothetical protein